MVDPKGKTHTNGEPPTGDDSLSGQIGHYRIVAELGRGGMGTVYRAHEPSLNRYVAIKVLARHLADDESLVARFAREAKSVAALNHPNIVHIYYTGEEQGRPYFVMECVEGENLADLIRREGTLAPKEAARILLESAAGLAAAHDRGIVHRDIKPSNLMIDGSGRVKITDFGIALARDVGDKLTTTGQFIGTTGYVSPEVCKGQTVDSRSDIFSLGVVLYEMLAGSTPFNDDSPLGLMMQVVQQPVPDVRGLNPGVDEKLVQILDRMIEKNPDDRYQTCHELIADLKRYIAGAPLAEIKQAASLAERDTVVTGTEGPGANAVAVEHRRRRWPALLLLLLFVAAGAGGVWWVAPLWQAQRDDPVATEELPIETSGERALTHDQPPADETPAVASGDMPGQVDAASVDTASDGAANGLLLDEPEESASEPSTLAATESAGATAEPASGATQALAAPTPEPAQAAVQIPRVLVVTRGDRAIAGTVEQILNQRLADRGYQVMDAGLVSGAGRYIGDWGVDLEGLSEAAVARGATLMVVASVVPVGATELDYYGEQETLYSSRIELRAYDPAEQTNLGGGWNQDLEYTALNATARGREAAAPIVSELMRAVGNPDN